MEKLRIFDLAKPIVSDPSRLSTRFVGKRLWEIIQAQLHSYATDTVVLLSFADIEMIDASLADEVFARLAVLRAKRDFPYCYLILTELNETCEYNLQAALNLSARTGRDPNDATPLRNCVLVVSDNKVIRLMGKYENHVQETFSLLNSEKELTAREVSNILDISLNAASTRLKTIADLGLAKRVEIRDEQGKQYSYCALI